MTLFNFREVLVLLPHYAEALNCCGVTFNVTMVVYRAGGLEMFFETLYKGSGRFTNIFLITFHPFRLACINHPTCLGDGIFVLGATMRFLMVLPLL